MSYPPKVNAALVKLAETGIKPRVYAPPILRLLWKIGIPLPPPLFAGFWLNFSFAALWFGLFWGLGMWFWLWSGEGYSVIHAIVLSALAGSFFGAWMAFYYQRTASKHKLPKWSEIEPIP